MQNMISLNKEQKPKRNGRPGIRTDKVKTVYPEQTVYVVGMGYNDICKQYTTFAKKFCRRLDDPQSHAYDI